MPTLAQLGKYPTSALASHSSVACTSYERRGSEVAVQAGPILTIRDPFLCQAGSGNHAPRKYCLYFEPERSTGNVRDCLWSARYVIERELRAVIAVRVVCTGCSGVLCLALPIRSRYRERYGVSRRVLFQSDGSLHLQRSGPPLCLVRVGFSKTKCLGQSKRLPAEFACAARQAREPCHAVSRGKKGVLSTSALCHKAPRLMFRALRFTSRRCSALASQAAVFGR